MRSISAGRISALVKCKAMRRKSLRNILFETLENRALMTSGPSLFPPLGDLPPAFLAPPKPGVGPGNMSLNPGPSSDPGFIFGPREKVWVSEVVQTMEGDEPGRLRIERTNTKSHLQVTWRMLRDSTAQPGIDYIEPKPIFEFAPGQSTIDVPMLSIDDDLPEPTETFRFVLADSSRIGTWVSPDIVTFQITDNDLGGGKQRPFVELLPPTDGEEECAMDGSSPAEPVLSIRH